MRVLVFGDSITQGFWDTDGGWVDRLRRDYDTLQSSDLQGRNEPSVFNLGISADNSKDVLDRIQTEIIARTRGGNLPVVLVQVGVNDSSTDNESEGQSVRVSIEDYENNLKDIIKKTKSLSSRLIFIGLSACDQSKTTPVSWGNFHYTNASIKRYEDKMKEVADTNEIPFIPLFNNFKKELDAGRNYLPDGLHPNNQGHKLIADMIKPEIDKILAEIKT